MARLVARIAGLAVVCAAVVTTAGEPAGAAEGDLDPSFGGSGTVITTIPAVANATALALQPDGRVLVAARGIAPDGRSAYPVVVRYEHDGTLDATFGSGGIAVAGAGLTWSFGAPSLALGSDGTIVVAGAALQTPSVDLDIAVARLRPDGSLDAAFGSGGAAVIDLGTSGDFAMSVGVQPNGRIVVTGGAGSPSASLSSASPGTARSTRRSGWGAP